MDECADILPLGAPPLPPGETAASWVLADLDSGTVLAARNPHARHRPASLLKVLTALVVLQRLDLNTTVDGTQEDANIPGSRVGVGPGGHYTVRQLLTGLLLNSGNDAANALARQLGGLPATLDAMASTATDLGALDTRPTSPSGLDAPGMSTSAYDLTVVFRAAMRRPEFAEIDRLQLFDWPGRGDLPGFKISNDNRMLTNYPGTIGGKTGFTDDARHTRIAAAERQGRRLVVVLMRGEQYPVPMDVQAARLLDYGFALPVSTPWVGMLVEHRPEEPKPSATPQPAPAGLAPSLTAPPRGGGDDLTWPLVIGGIVVVVGVALSILIAQCRRRS
ncbi:MAG: D-alanyl-D-alanine carboxypeptidase [Pseudonocardia sp.]|nr:D-alanyl-D-alanine carboxypeptidase [Pseudonocardia sp.]